MRLAGRVESSLGESMAERLAEEGANIVAVDINHASIEAFVEAAKVKGQPAIGVAGEQCGRSAPANWTRLRNQLQRTKSRSFW